MEELATCNFIGGGGGGGRESEEQRPRTSCQVHVMIAVLLFI